MNIPKIKRPTRSTLKLAGLCSVLVVAAVALFSGVCITTMTQLRALDQTAQVATVSMQQVQPTAMKVDTEKKTKAPAECLQVLRDADYSLVLSSYVMAKYDAKIKAVKTGDLHLIHKATRDLRYAQGALTDQIDKYSSARELCRKAGK